MIRALRASKYLLPTTVALSAACLSACSADGRPPPSAEPTPPVDAGDESVVATGPDAGDGGAQAEAAHEDDANFTDLDAATFLCNPYGGWGPGQAIPGLPSNGTATALAITPDELTMAWIDAADGGAFSYHVVDRASAGAPFAAADVKKLALDSYAAGGLGISLTVDGLGVVVVKADQKGFGQANRTSRTHTFRAPSESSFVSINAWVIELSGTVADPAFGADGRSFLYSQFGSGVTLYESRETEADSGGSDVWAVGTPQGSPALSVVEMPDGGGERYRHPASLSADGLVLFLRDEYPTSTGRGVYRTSVGAPFGPSTSLGDWSSVHPNASCNVLYYIENGDMKVSPKM